MTWVRFSHKKPVRSMKELDKVTAFVVTYGKPHQLLVFDHPTAGLQLPAGTVEPGEAPVAAAKREVREETGVEVTSRGVVLRETIHDLGPDRAALLATVDRGGRLFRRGHLVKVLTSDKAQGMAQIHEETFNYDESPPKLLSVSDGNVPIGALAQRIRRTFVLFVEDFRVTEPWSQQADGHHFEVRWTRLRRDIPLVDGLKNQKEWLTSNFNRLKSYL